MSKEIKLSEAQHFLNLMEEELDKAIFGFSLSAFLSSARSVLQYCHADIKDTQQRSWYDSWMRNPIISFMKEQRNKNIHKSTVSLKHLICGETRDNLSICDFASITIRRANGTVETDDVARHSTQPEPANSPEFIELFFFDDWKGREDVLTLCQKYLNLVIQMLDDGKKHRYIT